MTGCSLCIYTDAGKLSRTETGRLMSKGEFASMSQLHKFSKMAPKPLAWGTFESDSATHFFLCEFIDLIEEVPDIVDFCEEVAELHRRSAGQSPGNGFGFEVVTCNGRVPQHVTWSASWEIFYTESLKQLFQQEAEVHGPCEEFDELLPIFYDRVCPRLLRPLETDGNTIEPILIHGDLWDGNVGVDAKTGLPVIFDASALWAHNEYEHHIWRGVRYKITRAFRREYFNYFPISPPEDDWDDRNLLYSVSADLHDSILYANTLNFRNLIITTIKQLIFKFSDGYTGSAPAKSGEIVNLQSTNEPVVEKADLDQEVPHLSAPEPTQVAGAEQDGQPDDHREQRDIVQEASVIAAEDALHEAGPKGVEQIQSESHIEPQKITFDANETSTKVHDSQDQTGGGVINQVQGKLEDLTVSAKEILGSGQGEK